MTRKHEVQKSEAQKKRLRKSEAQKMMLVNIKLGNVKTRLRNMKN